jgi:hypothetical protein
MAQGHRFFAGFRTQDELKSRRKRENPSKVFITSRKMFFTGHEFVGSLRARQR